MLKFYFTLLAFFLMGGCFMAQISVPPALQSFGSGTQTTHLLIDFNDESQRDCWSFTYHYDGNPTLGDMLADIQSSYPWISFDLAGGFLNSVALGNQSQSSGNPDYWMTFSYDTSGNWLINNGLSAPLNESSIFGCSYTGLDSAWIPLFYPQNPHSVLKNFSPDSISQWIGNGSQQALLVIDFNDGSASECYAWGFRFDGNASAQSMIEAIAAADPNISFNLDFGFLNDIIYGSQQGLAANPEYWSTFSGSNPYSWDFNSGIDAPLSDGLWFGCSYTAYDLEWNPIYYPENPLAAVWVQNLQEIAHKRFDVGPNPASDKLSLRFEGDEIQFEVYDMSGKLQLSGNGSGKSGLEIDVKHLPSGVYQLKLMEEQSIVSHSFVKF